MVLDICTTLAEEMAKNILGEVNSGNIPADYTVDAAASNGKGKHVILPTAHRQNNLPVRVVLRGDWHG